MSAISGFIGGVLGALFVVGMRKMLASTVFRRKISVGNLYKRRAGDYDYWCICMIVNASSWWKMLAASLEDVRAVISFTGADGSKERFTTAWVQPSTDAPSITLQIGGFYYTALVATMLGGEQLSPLSGYTGKLFLDNQDIILELNCGGDSLGRWLYKDAIVNGVMQEVSPTKIEG